MTPPKNDDMRDAIADAEATMDVGSNWPGMTYEQGVADALRWAMGDGIHPLVDAE